MTVSMNGGGTNNQKGSLPSPEVLKNTSAATKASVNPLLNNNPSTTSKIEEFTYQPKPRINLKKASKILVGILSFLVILIPLVIVFIKFNPLAGKKAEKKGEVVWWALGLNESVLNKMIEEYTANNPKAKIKLVVQSETDYRERLMNSLKEGSGPDVFSIHNSWVPMLIDYLDGVPQKVYGKDEYSKDYYPVIVRNMTTTAGIVGIPLEYDALTLYINEDIFSFSGKTVPRTWDEFNQVAVDLTTKGDGGLILQSGAAMGLTTNVDYWPEIIALLMLQNKSNLFAPSGQPSYEAIAAFGEFNNTLKIWNSTLPKSTVAFAEGKVAMFFAPAKVASEIKKINPDLRFKTVVIPQVRKDDPNESEIAYSTYWVQSVWKGSSDKELAWDFLKYLSSEESLTGMFNLSKDLGVTPMIYPRIDMRDKLINDKIFGSVVAQAPFSTSWYLVDRTHDGATGINSVVNAAYKKSVDTVSASKGSRDPVVFFKPLIAELKKGLLTFNVTK